MRPEHWRFTIPLRLRSLFCWAQAERELDEELRDHLERTTEEYVAQGMPQEEAHAIENSAQSYCRSSISRIHFRAMSNSILTSSFTFTVPPATATGVIPKARWRNLAEPW